MKSKHVLAWLFCAVTLSSVAHASDGFQTQLLLAHNIERQSFAAPPMVWDARLAAAADSYAYELARTGRWGHSAASQRVGQGENLWMGTRAAFRLGAMVGSWTAERRLFRAGVFPDVSRSGSWHDVGHYTQMIWPATTRVGCGFRSSAQQDYLVCRYSNAGNVMGASLGNRQYASR